MNQDEPYKPADFARRPSSPTSADHFAELAKVLFERLQAYERRSHPSGGEATARQKDMNAFSALECAGKLVDVLVGWAIDHTVGLAINGQQWVPLQPGGAKNHPEDSTKKNPEYLAKRAAVDDHVHEKTGGQESFENLDPVTIRKMCIGLLRANPGGFPRPLQRTMIEALEAPDFGDTHEIMKPVKGNRKRGLRELRLQLQAIVR